MDIIFAMKSARQGRTRSKSAISPEPQVRILIADASLIQSQLLARALRARSNFQIATSVPELAELQPYLHANPVDVVVLWGNQGLNLGLVRSLHLSHPNVAVLLLANAYDQDLVVNAFRSGVRGIFPFTQAPFPLLCKCIVSLAKGEIWINHQQLHYVLGALSEVNTLRVVNSNGKIMLTPREEQVVALVADGLSNREAAKELGLSEHTIKKYIVKIFDKLGISTRVELVLYAVSHGQNRQAEWMPAGT